MRPTLLLLAAALVALPSTVVAQDDSKVGTRPQPQDEQKSGVAPRGNSVSTGRVYIGERAPDFELDAATGKPMKLSNRRGDWILLAFADRRTQLLDLRTIDQPLRMIGARIVGVCHEKAHTLRTFSQRDSIDFALLADPTGQVAAEYGLFDGLRTETRPGYLVLDRRGVVRFMILGRLLPPAEIQQLVEYAVENP